VNTNRTPMRLWLDCSAEIWRALIDSMAARGVFRLPVAGQAPIQPIALSVLDLLAKDRMPDEAFADLLCKHGRPVAGG
jgi:hypothetical protein